MFYEDIQSYLGNEIVCVHTGKVSNIYMTLNSCDRERKRGREKERKSERERGREREGERKG